MYKKIVLSMLVLSLMFNCSIRSKALTGKSNIILDPSDYTDIVGTWAENSICNALRNGIVYGTTSTTFDPDAPITRAQMAVMMSRIFESSDTADLRKYIDVPTNAWYYDGLSKAVRLGIIQGNGSMMYPNNYITRQEAAALLYRAFCTEYDDFDISFFSDYQNISQYAIDAVKCCIRNGAITIVNGKIEPTKIVTRAEFTSMIYSFVQNFERTNVDTLSSYQISGLISDSGRNYSRLSFSGNLYLTEGLKSQRLNINNCKINGSLVIRGGGKIFISNNSSIKTIILCNGVGDTILDVDSTCVIDKVIVKDCASNVTLKGTYNEIYVESDDTHIEITDAYVQHLDFEIGLSPYITIDKYSLVESYKSSRYIRDTSGNVYAGEQIAYIPETYAIAHEIGVSYYNPISLREDYGMSIEDLIVNSFYSVSSNNRKINIEGNFRKINLGTEVYHAGYYLPIRVSLRDVEDDIRVKINDTVITNYYLYDDDDVVRVNMLIPFDTDNRTATVSIEPLRGNRYDSLSFDLMLDKTCRFN